MKRKYGLVWEGPGDARKLKFKVAHADPTIQKVDLTSQFPPAYDQLQLGACVDNTFAAYGEYLQHILNLPVKFRPSRLYLYYYARKEMGSQYLMQDSGSTVQNGAQSMAHGFCSESSWTYSDDPIKFRLPPPFWCDNSAKLHKVPNMQYESVDQTVDAFRYALQQGHPVAIGFQVYSSFESDEVAKTGIMSMPTANEQLLGGHCTLVVGYDDVAQQFIVRNSWGSGWGQNGYFRMPYAFLMNPDYASDFWLIRSLT